MKSKLKVSLFSIFFILISCEKDDICIEDEIGTPRIILSFYDKIDKNLRKPVENLLIKGLEKEDYSRSMNHSRLNYPPCHSIHKQ